MRPRVRIRQVMHLSAPHPLSVVSNYIDRRVRRPTPPRFIAVSRALNVKMCACVYVQFIKRRALSRSVRLLARADGFLERC